MQKLRSVLPSAQLQRAVERTDDTSVRAKFQSLRYESGGTYLIVFSPSVVYVARSRLKPPSPYYSRPHIRVDLRSEKSVAQRFQLSVRSEVRCADPCPRWTLVRHTRRRISSKTVYDLSECTYDETAVQVHPVQLVDDFSWATASYTTFFQLPFELVRRAKVICRGWNDASGTVRRERAFQRN